MDILADVFFGTCFVILFAVLLNFNKKSQSDGGDEIDRMMENDRSYWNRPISHHEQAEIKRILGKNV